MLIVATAPLVATRRQILKLRTLVSSNQKWKKIITRSVSEGSEVDYDDQVVSHSLAIASGWDWHAKRNFKIARRWTTATIHDPCGRGYANVRAIAQAALVLVPEDRLNFSPSREVRVHNPPERPSPDGQRNNARRRFAIDHGLAMVVPSHTPSTNGGVVPLEGISAVNETTKAHRINTSQESIFDAKAHGRDRTPISTRAFRLIENGQVWFKLCGNSAGRISSNV